MPKSQPKVYTFGYGGRSVDELLELAEQLDAVIFDVRYSPRSRAPQWNRNQLEAIFGESYCHVQAFGNANYRGGPIQIVSYEAGKAAIEASERNVILMCVCKDVRSCHRTVIGERLRRDGFEVHELSNYQRALTFPDIGFEDDADEPIIGSVPPFRR